MADDPARQRSRPVPGRLVGPARAGEGKVSHRVDERVEVSLSHRKWRAFAWHA